MTNKRIRLPKDEAIGPDHRAQTDDFIDTKDVEGHGFFPNPAPPAGLTHRSPSQGGEAVPTDEDAAGPEH